MSSQYYPYIRLTKTYDGKTSVTYVQALDVIAIESYDDGSWLRLNGGHNIVVLERPEEILKLILEVDNDDWEEEDEEEESWR